MDDVFVGDKVCDCDDMFVEYNVAAKDGAIDGIAEGAFVCAKHGLFVDVKDSEYMQDQLSCCFSESDNDISTLGAFVGDAVGLSFC